MRRLSPMAQDPEFQVMMENLRQIAKTKDGSEVVITREFLVRILACHTTEPCTALAAILDEYLRANI